MPKEVERIQRLKYCNYDNQDEHASPDSKSYNNDNSSSKTFHKNLYIFMRNHLNYII